MNEDTNETFQRIKNEDEYYFLLKTWVGNELLFIDTLVDIITDINKQLTNENQIEYRNVNGNEIYIKFCEWVGNEQPGWK